MTSTELTVVKQVRSALDKMQPELRAALPAHIEPGQFIRVAQTAVQTGRDLDQCTTKSVLGACVKAAETGLMPDGEEGAIVAYNVKVSKKGEKDRWEKQAKFMPMIRGLRKQVQQSGMVKDWRCRIVYAKDEFRYICGDEERLEHVPAFEEDDYPVRVYSIAVLENGEISRHVMRMDQVERIRRRSRSPESGPWVTDYEEMAKKTCMRQHYKALPRAKDDMVRQRLVGSIDALDDAQGVIDVEPKQIPAEPPALMIHQNATEALRRAVETSAFDPETGELPPMQEASTQPEEGPEPPKQQRKRKTAAERLAEADGKSPSPAGPAASRAPATSSAATNGSAKPAGQAKANPNAQMLEDYKRHKQNAIEEAAAEETGGSFGIDPGPDDVFPGDLPSKFDEVDPEVLEGEDSQELAYREGWNARMNARARSAPMKWREDQDAIAAYQMAWDQADRAMRKQLEEGQDMTQAESDRLLDEAAARAFV